MSMSTRRRVDRSEAEEQLEAWSGSGLGFRDYCAREGIDGRSLRYVRADMERCPPTGRSTSSSATLGHGKSVQLVELTLPLGPEHSVYRVVVGEITVEVDDSFREETLARLLGVVARC